ncbi:kinase-like domain-containing protein [Hysterangium stoloniferum]|nr:kinase-like domain-containing protein [Hysterangium stoloniferum]
MEWNLHPSNHTQLTTPNAVLHSSIKGSESFETKQEPLQMASPLPPHLAALLQEDRRSRQAHEQHGSLWEHLQPFLASRGYQLAWNGDTQRSPDLKSAANPFSPRVHEAFAAATAGRNGVRWGGPRAHPFLMGGYDRYQRFVVLKIALSNSNEVAIIQRLSGHNARQDVNNHTIPVLDILPAGECTIIVMPAWELTLRQCVPVARIKDFISIAIQCFQGLEYMHKQRVAHLDIYPSNILVNHIANRPKTPFLHAFNYRLAYIDFEFSMRISQTTPLIDVRCLPPTYSGIPEVKARCRHVDPFACDVYALGQTLKEHVKAQIENEQDETTSTHPLSQELRQQAPLYVALLDRMTSSDPSRRPLVGQALQEALAILSHF